MRTIIHDTKFGVLPLSKSYKNNLGFYKEILLSIISLLNYMINRHSKTLLLMFNVNYPATVDCQNNNIMISKSIDALRNYCKRKRIHKRTGNLVGDYCMRYLWTRETNPSDPTRNHVHLLVFLNGNKLDDAHRILNRLKRQWFGSVNLCDDEYDDCNDDVNYESVMIERKDPNLAGVYAEAFQWASYLAKVYSKDADKHVNNYRSSILPKFIQIAGKLHPITTDIYYR